MNSCFAMEQKIARICYCEYKYFLNKSNVVGVALGNKIKGGFYTCQKCITVFVRRKLPVNSICRENIIPKIYNGIITDVVETGMPTLCSLTKKIRPVKGGYSIGVDGLEAGTMGCLVADSKKDYILTCNHVVAGNNPSGLKKVVVQPAPKYGGKALKDVVGVVSEFIPVEREEENLEDAALVETDRSKASIDIAFKGVIKGVDIAALGQIVEKVGATTELTNGVVENKNATLKINFLGREIVFKDQIITTKMSNKGDSGSVLLSTSKKALGLLMADTPAMSIFNNINNILSVLEVHILRN
ncbi:hypothetical protein ADU80_08595 [Clostridium botulinum]|uniref:Peptidase S1 domain-containing protein n=2 Tax=Clostridium botulinum TaxID=1491 RepID=A0A9Q1UZL2_CLOBO|nr:hypothetical protein [Clostridium botulinum]KLU76573.1 hypothetical protein CBC3_02660 [Clostridium botulinum V891]KOA75958.1 hypothetical protein ADU77_09615 [Clostridium botulinum]KOA77373.1 hypothetical protein ADU78_02870 [Clostridium botulinum]KOA82891.1 hypothetical protein ADU75_11920 [Clostridium botulinum]KOA85220.1 hypothetical protein ADU80_08595 [Clostridium botulinum]